MIVLASYEQKLSLTMTWFEKKKMKSCIFLNVAYNNNQGKGTAI